jgi:hypothetical protein
VSPLIHLISKLPEIMVSVMSAVTPYVAKEEAFKLGVKFIPVIVGCSQ